MIFKAKKSNNEICNNFYKKITREFEEHIAAEKPDRLYFANHRCPNQGFSSENKVKGMSLGMIRKMGKSGLQKSSKM